MKNSCIISAFSCVLFLGCTDSLRHAAPTQEAGKLEASEAVLQDSVEVERALVESSEESFVAKKKVVTLTPSAVAKLKQYLGEDSQSYVRLSIIGDGYNGFSYGLRIDESEVESTDYVDESYGFAFVTDQRGKLYVDGTTIDWLLTEDGREGFKFDNPNAVRNEPANE